MFFADQLTSQDPSMNTKNLIRSRSQACTRSQSGFGMAIALAVLAVFALIAGAIAMANRGSTSKIDMEAAKIMASSIVNRGNELLVAAQRLAQDRDITQMVFATTATAPQFGLYDPLIGIATDVKVPGKAFVTNADASYVLDKTAYSIIGLGVNGATVAALTATLPGLTLQACQAVNKIIFNDSIDAAPAVTTTNLTRPEGCLAVSLVYTYYKVLGAAA